MKKLIFVSLMLQFGFVFTTIAQKGPYSFKYQSVVRNTQGTVITNQKVNFKFSINSDSANGKAVYIETDTVTTNAFGVANIEIGKGVKLLGNLASVSWSTGIFFLNISADLKGGTNFKFLGSNQLLSVPFAYFANESGRSLTDHDTSKTNEIQMLSFSNDSLFLSNGGYIYLGNYNNSAAILELYGKIINDSNYLKSLIDSSLAMISVESQQRIGYDTIETQQRYSFDTLESRIRYSFDTFLYHRLLSDSIHFFYEIHSTNAKLHNEVSLRDDTDDWLWYRIDSLKAKVLLDSNSLKMKLNSHLIADKDTSQVNELQTISISNDTIYLSNGGFVKLPTNHYVGELYGGGVVFYVDHTGQHGLICSMTDLSSAYEWSNVDTVLIGSTAQSDWDGQTNTNAIVSQTGHTSSAAKLCNDYSNDNYGTGVFSDWYLPTNDGLNLLYNAKYRINKTLDTDGNSATTAIVNSYYWSSTEYTNNLAICISFAGGSNSGGLKSFTQHVRAVRAF